VSGKLLRQEDDLKYGICFFNGLDEYKGENVDYRTFVKKNRRLGEENDVETCVNARPCTKFLERSYLWNSDFILTT